MTVPFVYRVLGLAAALALAIAAAVVPGQGRPAERRQAREIAAPPEVPVALGMHIEEYPGRTRFILELSDPVKPRVFALANPDRVVIELPELLWRIQAADRPSGQGLVKRYRYGEFRAGESRVVIALNGPAVAAEGPILPPEHGLGYRVVIGLAPTTQAKFEETAGWPSDLRARELTAREMAQAPALRAPDGASVGGVKKKVVVIDPGHGGIDAGTTGVSGVREKDLVLNEAQRLADILRKRGYTVLLTREADVYVPLAERMNIARRANADLFLSLHADSNPDARIQGASVYTLSERGSDREAAALARKENESDVVAGVDLSEEGDTVSHILIELAQRGTMSRSAHFAGTLVSELSRTTGVISRDPHRSAAFVVLQAPDVPSVLVELGYLSNAQDCKQMSTDAWRNTVAASLARAVDKYMRPEHAAPRVSQSAAR